VAEAADSLIVFGQVDQLKIGRERPRQDLGVGNGHAGHQGRELVSGRCFAGTGRLGQSARFFLDLECVLTRKRLQDIAEDSGEEIDIVGEGSAG
jgi:hypothetical protein